MKKEIMNNRNKKPVFKSKSVPVGIEQYLPSKKLEFLDSYKISLEILLDSIKSCLIHLISISGKDKYKSIKSLLNELKEELDFSLNEKESNFKYLEKINHKIKIPLQNKIFMENKKEKDNNIYSNKKHLNNHINFSNLKSETELLRMLNFKVENDIKQIDNTISANVDENEYLNLYLEYPFIEEKINMCLQQKYFPLVSKLLQSQIQKKSKKLKKISSLKKYQNDQIIGITQNIYRLKTLIASNKNNNKKIQQEESKDLSNSISFNTLCHINNIIKQYNEMKQGDEEENEEDNIIILNNENLDITNNSNRLDNQNENKNNIQNIINYNMNVNLNINYGGLNYNESLTYNRDRNDKNSKNYSYNRVKQESIYSSTNSLPRLINDSIKEIKESTSKFK
jgi:hypothetical protein